MNFFNASKGPQQLVSEPLVVPLAVIVVHILGDRVPKRCLPDEDHPIQTFFFDGADKSLRERIPLFRDRFRMSSSDSRRVFYGLGRDESLTLPVGSLGGC